MQKILVSILTCMVLVLIAQTTRAEGDDAKKEAVTVAQPLLEDFVTALTDLLENHNDIIASGLETKRLDLNSRVISKSRFPNLALKSSYGREDQVKPDARNVLLNPRDLNLTLTMPIFDRSLHHTVKQVRLSVEQGALAQKTVIDRILLEGIAAQIGLSTSREVLELSQKSVQNIRNQTELESAKVEKGSGLTSDLLQAKTQLAGAQARETQAQSGFQLAINRYVAVFGNLPASNIGLNQIPLPASRIPTNLDSAIETAISQSAQLGLQKTVVEIARKGVELSRATSFLPKLNLTLETKYKKDFGSTRGFARDSIAKLELGYNFNTAGSAFDTFKGSTKALMAASRQYDQATILITEQVKNTWTQYEFAKANAQFLDNQAAISEEFLELARKEQALGSRTLLDVLAGETTYINAATDAFAAKGAVVQAAYTLLAIIGRLDLQIFELN